MDSTGLQAVFESSRLDTLERHRSYINPLFVPTLQKLSLDRLFVRAEGTRLWDDDDREYLDLNGNFGAVSVGHNHPEVILALKAYFERRIPTFCRLAPPLVTSALAERLATLFPGDLSVSYLCQSGTEAVEGAMKLARAATGRWKLLSTKHGYHGKTLGSLSLMAGKLDLATFGPMLPGCDRVAFGDLVELERQLAGGEYAGFIVEPVQSNGGVHLPPANYLEEVQRCCRRSGTFFILDEIATGFGRCGKMFASEHWNLEPDIMTFGKGLSGGIMPIGGYATTPQIWTRAYGTAEKYLLHSSTFGDNNLTAAVALATLDVIASENLVDACAATGSYFLDQLKRLQERHFIISDVRGLGLLIGVEFDADPRNVMDRIARGLLNRISDKLSTYWIVSRLLNDFAILTAGPLVGPRVVRLMPPLSLKKEEVDRFIVALDSICSELTGYSRLLKQAGLNIGRRYVQGYVKQ